MYLIFLSLVLLLFYYSPYEYLLDMYPLCRAGRERRGTSGTSMTPVLPSTLLGLTPPPRRHTPSLSLGGTGSQCKLATMLDRQQLFMKSRFMVSAQMAIVVREIFAKK